MSPRRTRLSCIWPLVLVAFVATFLGPAARAEDQGHGGPPPHAKGKGAARANARQAAWKAQRTTGTNPNVVDAVGPPYVGRASMVINAAGTVSYTKEFIGLQASCDSDPRNSAEWQPNTAHALHDNVVPLSVFGGNKFMATTAGTTGAVEPVWPAAFGATVVDGTITWVNAGDQWVAGRAYQAGMVAAPAIVSVYRLGFLFLAQNAGTSGATEPVWPTTAGTTVNDNGITWKAIGFYPGAFTGCSPMQIVSRASGGAETTIAAEGDLVPGGNGEQLMGWSELLAMNSSGKVAFRAESMGFIRNDDESSSGIFTAGPGAGALTKLIANGANVGSRHMCGFSAMTAMNDAGQVLFDGYGRQHAATWTPNTVVPAGQIYPTVDNGFVFGTGTGGTTGATEPVWPTSPSQTVVDGTVTWNSATEACDEDDHSLVLNTGGVSSVLVAQGSAVGGSTVIGFGKDDDSQLIGNCGICEYEQIDGKMNASGHVPVVLNLLDGTQGVFNFTAPGVSTQVARVGVGGVTAVGPRVSINDSDQVVYRGTVGGVDHLFRFTPPATTATIVSVGDVVNGKTISSIGAFSDINNGGNVVYGAFYNGDNNSAFYFWDGTNHEVASGGTSDPPALSSEMITLNNANQVAYVTGTTSGPDETDGASEGHEADNPGEGAFLWTLAGGSVKFITNGDVISGGTVSAIYAQHPSFVRRQFSSAGCLATVYMVGGDDPEQDCTEGDPSAGCNANGGGKLFVSCGAVCPTITLSPPTLPGGSQGTPYSQQITAIGGAAPYAFTETGALPNGITLTTGGLLAGTPTVAGSFPITVTATDANTCTGIKAYTLVIGSPTQVTIALAPPSRSIVVGSSATETATINIAQPTDTIVTLTSSDTTLATVPATVTILANQHSATFQITAVAVGGPVTITATLPPSFNAVPATATVTVVAVQAAAIPTLSGWMLALMAAMLAAVAILLMKLR
jgi:hypothetical protein